MVGALLFAAVLAVDPELLLEQGRSAAVHGEYELARKNFARCLELDPKNPACTLELGHAYVELGDREKARSYLRRYMEVAPGPSQSREGYLETRAERLADEAVAGYYAVDREPQTPRAKAAVALLSRGDSKGAAAAAAKCLERDGSDADCHLQLARAALALGQKKPAHEHFVRFFVLTGRSAIFNRSPQEYRHRLPAGDFEDDW